MTTKFTRQVGSKVYGSVRSLAIAHIIHSRLLPLTDRAPLSIPSVRRPLMLLRVNRFRSRPEEDGKVFEWVGACYLQEKN